MKANKSIGVFDSGLGGLRIFKSLTKNLPDYNYIYLGDNARLPYGSRSFDVIYKFTVEAVDSLFKNGCEIIILACNTASAESLRKIQQEYLPRHYPEKRVLGVIVPTVEYVANELKSKKVGVIGTQSTIDSRVFQKEFNKINPEIEVFQKASSLLVPLIESGEGSVEIENAVLRNYLKTLTSQEIDTLILGCTHYGFWKEKIKKIVSNNIHIVCEEDVVPEKLKDYLQRHPEIEKSIKKEKERLFYLTDFSYNFKYLAEKFFQGRINLKKIKL
ncbi:MAG: glutamate racemase [Patescibacteria group bacterium]|nr:glutamate racemase [Patescibacteria group bacterium]